MEKKEGKSGKRTRKGSDQENKKKKRANVRQRTGSRLRNKLNKQKSRSNMPQQKKYAQKVKDRKRKSEVNDIVKESPKDYSTQEFKNIDRGKRKVS